MGYDAIKCIDGREAVVSVIYLGCTHPAEVRFGETTLLLADFLTKVEIYLEGDDAEVDLRRTIREALSRAKVQLRPTSGARIFETPRLAKDCNGRDTPPFELGGARVSARDLYDFLWYLMQKLNIESFPGDTREHFLRRYAREYGRTLCIPGRYSDRFGVKHIAFAAVAGAVFSAIHFWLGM